MKRNMNLAQFKRYIEAHPPSKIVFDTQNQHWDYAPLRFHLTFTKIGVFYTPSQIVLSGELQKAGGICLQCVERIRVNEHDLYTMVTITCGTIDADIKNTFRLLMFN